jgi:hypothetical protein
MYGVIVLNVVILIVVAPLAQFNYLNNVQYIERFSIQLSGKFNKAENVEKEDMPDINI